MMKKLFLITALSLLFISAFAEEKSMDYQFRSTSTMQISGYNGTVYEPFTDVAQRENIHGYSRPRRLPDPNDPYPTPIGECIAIFIIGIIVYTMYLYRKKK